MNPIYIYIYISIVESRTESEEIHQIRRLLSSAAYLMVSIRHLTFRHCVLLTIPGIFVVTYFVPDSLAISAA